MIFFFRVYKFHCFLEFYTSMIIYLFVAAAVVFFFSPLNRPVMSSNIYQIDLVSLVERRGMSWHEMTLYVTFL